MELVHELIKVYSEIKDAEIIIKDLKRKRDSLSSKVEDKLCDDGIDSIKCDGHTVSLVSKLFASCGGNVPGVVSIVTGEGDPMGLLSINSSKLRAAVKEEGRERFFDNNPGLVGIVRVTEEVSLSIRRS